MRDILMPALGESVTEGALSRWMVREGDAVKRGDVIAEIETDKAVMEVEAIDSGVISSIVVPEGTSGVKVNAVIARLAERSQSRTPARAPKVFVSYRRRDTPHVAGRMFDRLVAHFGDANIFFDVDSIPLGVDFREHIQKFLQDCDFLVAVIGRQWVEPGWAADGGDTVDDFVRIELEAALEKGVRLLPVLTDGAPMPAASELPATLRQLARINAPHVRGGRDFHIDMAKIIAVIETHRREIVST